MSLTDLFRKARGACQCSQQSQWAEIAPIDQPAAQSTAISTAQPVDQGAGVEFATDDQTRGIARSIDVSHLPPPLPMVRILETLRALGAGETLLVHHTRRPIHLYPKLDALGCTHETTEVAPGKIQVRITNPPARP